MKTFNWPYDLEKDRFSGDLALCSANSTPPKSVQAIILCAILNFSGDCQAIIPTFKYRDLNGKETIIKEWHYETIDVGNNFYNAPKTVNISWYPYGTFEVKKVKKLLEEEIEKHILFKNNIIKNGNMDGN